MNSINPAEIKEKMRSLSPLQRRALLKVLKEGGIDIAQFDTIEPREKGQRLQLSFAQQRLWFLSQLEGNTATYNVPMAFALTGTLNRAALIDSIKEIVARHEVLRTRFVADDGGDPRQIIDEPGHFEVDVETVASRDDLRSACEMAAARAFDLSADPLIRARLLIIDDNEHVLLIILHHTICDGWSLTVFFQELVEIYRALSEGKPSPLAPLPIQYADFALWQRGWLTGDVIQSLEEYWKRQLADLPPLLELPTDHPRPAVLANRGAREKAALSQKLLRQLNELSVSHKLSLFMTTLAAFQILLNRYSGHTDLAVGTPIANRTRAELDSLIGLFANTLVLRVDLSGDPTIEEFLQRVRSTAHGAYAYQDMPFEQLVHVLQPTRSLSFSPLFQVAFTLQTLPPNHIELPNLTLAPVDFAFDVAKFDITLAVEETPDGLLASMEYNKDLFDAATICRMLQHYERILTAIAENPAQKVAAVNLLSEEEKRQAVHQWNDTASAYPRDKCLHELFEDQVERMPQAIAVDHEGEVLSYRALNERANQVAHYLVERGVKPDTVVGLCLERSLEMIVGLLGIIKAGAAYVPMNPNYPGERIQYILRDCGAPLVLSQQAVMEKFSDSAVEWIALDDRAVHGRHIGCRSTANISRAQLGSTPGHLVHVIYTSGSTGGPKGVLVEQRGVVRLVCGTDFVELNADVVMLQQTTLSFDVSAFEIWGPLLNGGRLVVYGGDVMDIPRMMDTVSRAGVNTIALTPSLLQVWMDQYPQAVPGVKTLVVAGEALPVASVVRMYRLNPQLQIIDAYGPTENSVYSVAYSVPKTIQLGDVKPIGFPIAQSTAYVMDAEGQLVPVGCVGELYVGGAGVARGYLNQPALTAEKFIKDPFSDRPGARLYKTGDLVRRLADGAIEYLGRRDHQVKIRGFRVELGEIESTLLSHPGVQSCVVLAREDVPGDKRLVAYYAAREGHTISPESLRTQLKSGLPEYMVPSAYVPLEAIPLTPNGKIDRRALPAPEADAYGRAAYEAPQGETEEAVAKVWQELLHIDQVGRQDNFFELGGHSLLAMQFMAQIQATLALQFPLKTLFECPTVERFAASVDMLVTAREQLGNLHQESSGERQVGAL